MILILNIKGERNIHLKQTILLPHFPIMKPTKKDWCGVASLIIR